MCNKKTHREEEVWVIFLYFETSLGDLAQRPESQSMNVAIVKTDDHKASFEINVV
nr:hypothetical protein BdHM001_35560 [Bdellovibrio sp. HM001]